MYDGFYVNNAQDVACIFPTEMHKYNTLLCLVNTTMLL